MGKYKNLLVNLGVFALSTVATRLITFLLVPLYTYNMSTGEFGITDMALTVVTLCVPLTTLSISDAALRFVIDDKENKEAYISIGFCVMLLSCLIVAALLPLLDLSFFGGLGNYKLLFFFLYVTNAFLNFHGNIARSLNQLKLITWDAITASFLTAIGAFIFISIYHLGVEGYFYSLILGSGVGILIFEIFGRHFSFITLLNKSDKALVKRMFVYAIPLIPNSLFWWVGTSINRFFITGMLGIAASGLFAAASKIPNLLNIVYNIFQTAWTLSAFQEFKKDDVSKFFSTVLMMLQALMGIGASCLIVLTPWLAKFLLQKDFFSSWTLIPVLILAFYFNALNSFYGTVFTTTLKTATLFTTTTFGAITSVFFTWILIPVLGLYGPCLAMVIGNFAVFVLRVFASRRIMVIKINYVQFLSVIVVLVLLVFIMVLRCPFYIETAVSLIIVLTIIQMICFYPYLKRMLPKLKRS